MLGFAGSRVAVCSPSADPVVGDIARNQRVIPISRTAAVVNSINGKRSISGYPQLIAMSLIPPNDELCSRKYANGTATNNSSGGWTTAVKMLD